MNDWEDFERRHPWDLRFTHFKVIKTRWYGLLQFARMLKRHARR